MFFYGCQKNYLLHANISICLFMNYDKYLLIPFWFISDNIQSWWEIPSVVHFCEVFSPFCEDLCPININVSIVIKYINISNFSLKINVQVPSIINYTF